jgi:sialic acid synthase SpsE
MRTLGSIRDRVYIIAEVGPNHDGKLENALRIIEQVASSGVDAIKFQTFASAYSVVAKGAPLAAYMKLAGNSVDQAELLEKVRLSYDDFRTIARACAKHRITFLSTPFDERSVEFLVELGVPLLKVPSGEITNGFLLRAVARTGLPLVISTGMATLSETKAALGLIRRTWAACGIRRAKQPTHVLMHCTSAYPAPFDSVNLRAMTTLAKEFKLPVGYSDHTLGKAVSIAAVACGARVIEKHVTPDTRLPGPDHAASLPLADLPGFVADIRAVEKAGGHGRKEPAKAEKNVKLVARRSIAAARDIPRGQRFTEDLLTALRPETGLSPMEAGGLLGRSARRSYRIGELIDPREGAK